MTTCQVCDRDMRAHLNRLSRIELTGADEPIVLKLSGKGEHEDSGLKLTGKVGCRRCFTAVKILGFFIPQLAQASGMSWTHATVYWHDGRNLVPVPREKLNLPKPVEHRLVAELGRIRVMAVDERGPGGANHDYLILLATPDVDGVVQPPRVIGGMQFQRGPVGQEGSREGITNEALLMIVWDRLHSFQSGAFACEQNEKARGCVNEALGWLEARTADRVARGVEGTVAP